MATPRIAKYNTSTTLTWSSGQNFNGFALIALIPPALSGVDYVTVGYGNNAEYIRLPQYSKVPIKEGKFNTQSGLYYNADITPPNSQYCLWYYDSTNQKIAGPSDLFTVSADPIVLPSLTLTAPSTSSTIPSPSTTSVSAVSLNFSAYVRQTPSGTMNGENATFTLNSAPASSGGTSTLKLYLNGILLKESTGYTISSTTITMKPGYIPVSTDILEAEYYVA